MDPKTVEEWAAYIKLLRGTQLWSKGIAVNSMEFVQMLKDEMMKPS